VYLVLIRGSNLDKPLNDGAINLTTGGLQRHRNVWIREMAESESQAALREWLTEHAPAFCRYASV